MNTLSIEDRAKIVRLLVEGTSLRSTSRITNIHIDTITRVLIQVGQFCQKFHDENVVNVNSRRIECDEIWQFVYAKEKNAPYRVRRNRRPPIPRSLRFLAFRTPRPGDRAVCGPRQSRSETHSASPVSLQLRQESRVL